MGFLTSAFLLLIVAELALSHPAPLPQSAVPRGLSTVTPSNELFATADDDAVSELKRQAQDLASDAGESLVYGTLLGWVLQRRWTEGDKTRCRTLMEMWFRDNNLDTIWNQQLELCESRNGARKLEKKVGKSLAQIEKHLKEKSASTSNPAFEERRTSLFNPVGATMKPVSERPVPAGALTGFAASVPSWGQALGWVNGARKAVGAFSA